MSEALKACALTFTCMYGYLLLEPAAIYGPILARPCRSHNGSTTSFRWDWFPTCPTVPHIGYFSPLFYTVWFSSFATWWLVLTFIAFCIGNCTTWLCSIPKLVHRVYTFTCILYTRYIMLVRSPTLHSLFNSTFGKHRIYSFGMGQTICRSSCLAGSWSPFKTISHIGSWSIQTTSHIGSWSPSKPFRIGSWSPFKTISHIGSWSIQTTSHIGSWSPFKTISHRFLVNLPKPFRI